MSEDQTTFRADSSAHRNATHKGGSHIRKIICQLRAKGLQERDGCHPGSIPSGQSDETGASYGLPPMESHGRTTSHGTATAKFFPMSILCWNGRGAVSPEFCNTIMELVTKYRSMLAFITETRVSAVRVEDIKTQLGFDRTAGIDSIGLSGGIWALWDSSRISVEVLPHGQQTLHMLVKEPPPMFAELLPQPYLQGGEFSGGCSF